jgi:hypothetical protein
MQLFEQQITNIIGGHIERFLGVKRLDEFFACKGPQMLIGPVFVPDLRLKSCCRVEGKRYSDLSPYFDRFARFDPAREFKEVLFDFAFLACRLMT